MHNPTPATDQPTSPSKIVQFVGNGGAIAYATVAAFHDHPHRDLVPPPTAEQRERIRESMLTCVQFTPLAVTPDLTILDGHTRRDLARECGWDLLAYYVVDLAPDKQDDFIVRTATDRRQLTPEQFADLVKTLRDKGWSHRRIAQATGRSKSSAQRVAAKSGVPGGTPVKVTGRDQKQYPARKPITEKPKPAVVPPVEPGQPEAEPIDDFEAKRLRLVRAGQEVIEAAKDYGTDGDSVRAAKFLRQLARGLTEMAAVIDPPKPRTPKTRVLNIAFDRSDGTVQ